jgi:zinc transport system substrate-binding protein
MRKTLLAAAVSAVALTTPAHADVPSVAVDISPVHSLVAKVMEGVGEPNLIVQAGATPHGYSLRPGEAEAMQNADVVFWVSDDLAPWIKESINSLASDAKSVELFAREGVTRLDYREGPIFLDHHAEHAEHDHGHDHSHDDGHDHSDDDGHDHGDHGHDHADEEGGHHHAHSGVNPHAWLDPHNARVWLDVIAEVLGEMDPENAPAYADNAADAKAEMTRLTQDIDRAIERVRGTNYIVFHDAYQYFEHRFDIPAAGAIRLGDASEPSPQRIEELRDLVAELDVACVFAEPQFNRGMIEAVFEQTQADIGVLDPLGSSLEPGPDMSPQLLRNLSDSLTTCLKK